MTMPGSTPPWFIERFQLPSGAAMSGGKMYFFVAGSTTVPKNVFSDYALTIPLTQPLVMDAAGSAPQYFMEAGLYKVLIKDAANILQHTRDNIEGAAGSGGDPLGPFILNQASDASPQVPGLAVVGGTADTALQAGYSAYAPPFGGYGPSGSRLNFNGFKVYQSLNTGQLMTDPAAVPVTVVDRVGFLGGTVDTSVAIIHADLRVSSLPSAGLLSTDINGNVTSGVIEGTPPTSSADAMGATGQVIFNDASLYIKTAAYGWIRFDGVTF